MDVYDSEQSLVAIAQLEQTILSCFERLIAAVEANTKVVEQIDSRLNTHTY